jgi:hypothetical protein
MWGCVYKDSQFARIFGRPTRGPAARMPFASYALFAARDGLTIFSSFNIPPLLSPYLLHATPYLSTPARAQNAAQFLAPAVMQVFSTPLHLLGLDLFNRQGAVDWRERVHRVGRDWAVSALARMARIVPAFGVGGVVNRAVRERALGQV